MTLIELVEQAQAKVRVFDSGRLVAEVDVRYEAENGKLSKSDSGVPFGRGISRSRLS